MRLPGWPGRSTAHPTFHQERKGCRVGDGVRNGLLVTPCCLAQEMLSKILGYPEDWLCCSSSPHNPTSDSLWVWGTGSRPGLVRGRGEFRGFLLICGVPPDSRSRQTLCLLQHSFLAASREERMLDSGEEVGRGQASCRKENL